MADLREWLKTQARQVRDVAGTVPEFLDDWPQGQVPPERVLRGAGMLMELAAKLTLYGASAVCAAWEAAGGKSDPPRRKAAKRTRRAGGGGVMAQGPAACGRLRPPAGSDDARAR